MSQRGWVGSTIASVVFSFVLCLLLIWVVQAKPPNGISSAVQATTQPTAEVVNR